MLTPIIVENNFCGTPGCINHIHSTTMAIIVIRLKHLDVRFHSRILCGWMDLIWFFLTKKQTPYLTTEFMDKAYERLTRMAFFTLAAGNEPIGDAQTIIELPAKYAEEGNPVGDLLSRRDNCFVAVTPEETIQSINSKTTAIHFHLSFQSLMNSIIGLTRDLCDHPVVVVYITQEQPENSEDPIGKLLRSSPTLRGIHRLEYPGLCEHVQLDNLDRRVSALAPTPTVLYEKHDHEPAAGEHEEGCTCALE